ncbi:Peptide chain release factor 2 [Pseudomonas sp. THAF187a]|nr:MULTISPECIES: peptide chain release factor H [unclassified Pseudomonas]QFT24570.1 Peptide chain release factor 2 [Pseudomonas sp. THAF187a]QFT44757.1 Peptide chain release factor 2 [Pseudomonas sp. THAF42]
MLLLQLSAGQGPAECALAVAKAMPILHREATALEVQLQLLEEETGPRPGTLRSVLFGLHGEQGKALATAWSGTMQWVCPSPFRAGYGRKNWFFSGTLYELPEALPNSQVRFETLRASGAGGQHVNTTDSAVRATHLATGISVKVQNERSQHANKRIALMLLAKRLKDLGEQASDTARAERRLQHHQLERGNAVRSFHGPGFDERS